MAQQARQVRRARFVRNVRMRSHSARNACERQWKRRTVWLLMQLVGRAALSFAKGAVRYGVADRRTDGQTKWSMRLITATSHKRRNLKYVHIENKKKQNKQHNWLSARRDESNCHAAVASCVSAANSFERLPATDVRRVSSGRARLSGMAALTNKEVI